MEESFRKEFAYFCTILIGVCFLLLLSSSIVFGADFTFASDSTGDNVLESTADENEVQTGTQKNEDAFTGCAENPAIDQAHADETGREKADRQETDASGIRKDGVVNSDGDIYYLENGVPQKNRWVLSEGLWMYTGADGKLYKNTVVEINGKSYGFNDTGIMQTGVFSVGGKEYLADDSGALVSNRWELDEKGWRYSGEEGQILTSQWIYYSGQWYYAKNDGYIYQNCTFEVDGNKYYAQSDGSIIQNRWMLSDGKWYYANPGGNFAKNQWIYYYGRWYYAKDDCSIYQNCIFEVNGSKYYANSGGDIFQNKWILDDGKWYYANPGGNFAKNQWIFSNGLWYYAKDDCSIYQNCLFEVIGEKYYANSGGDICQNCFVTIGNTKYYFTQRGSMGIDMFAYDNGSYLYFDENGKYDPTIKWTGSIVDIAKSQLGINTGEKYWRFYEGTPFVNGQVTPWCGCFIAWCLQQAGIIRAIHVGNMASVPYWLNYFDRTGRWDSAPNPGDVVVYDWKPYDGKRQGFHVGIVEKVKDGFVYTIEGNTGSSYFGEVLRRVRQVGNIYTIGYGRIM
ncbi:CHAP domain-containing protein [Baileyella intestinalis]|uniref:CHAP domain-containing protein n=1 Tax=Baileyella intestinalis TaxID=2606709 RepID=UPI0022E0466D|nr:CHAP domain-containing protein [Baileyella intestinalis]